MSREKEIRLICLLIYVLASCFAVYLARPYYFYSILIVLGPPSIANFIWLKNSRRKIFIFSLLTLLFFAPPIELVTRLADVWDVQSIFPRPFGLIPLENILFAFINIFWGLSFYVYFSGEDSDKKISSRMKYLIFLYIALSFFVYGFYFYDKTLIAASYFTMAVPVLIVPFIFIFGKYPELIRRTVLTTLFFAFIYFIYEMVSLQIGSWWWPGEYLYSFRIYGKVFPLDDAIIWHFLSTPVLIGGYEFFANGYKKAE